MELKETLLRALHCPGAGQGPPKAAATEPQARQCRAGGRTVPRCWALPAPTPPWEQSLIVAALQHALDLLRLLQRTSGDLCSHS